MRSGFCIPLSLLAVVAALALPRGVRAVDPLSDAAVTALSQLTDPRRLEMLSDDAFRAQLGPALGWLHVARRRDVAPEAVIARAFALNGLTGERARLTRESLLRKPRPRGFLGAICPRRHGARAVGRPSGADPHRHPPRPPRAGSRGRARRVDDGAKPPGICLPRTARRRRDALRAATAPPSARRPPRPERRWPPAFPARRAFAPAATGRRCLGLSGAEHGADLLRRRPAHFIVGGRNRSFQRSGNRRKVRRPGAGIRGRRAAAALAGAGG